MVRRRLIAVVVAALFASVVGQGESRETTPAQDIYRNFLGKWIGSSVVLRNGSYIKTPGEVIISELPEKHLMRLDYTFRRKEKTEVATQTQFVQLDPTKAKMKMHWQGNPREERYKVTGLDTFAETGLGDFTASQPVSDEGSTKNIDRITFHLGRDTLDYEWERTSDGQHYATIFMVSLSGKRLWRLSPSNRILKIQDEAL
jgi:hypothetical protein